MPFHQPGFGVRRMSKDIDILSSHSVSDIERVMNDIDDNVDGLRCRRIIPRDPIPIENFISYRVMYDSCLGKQDSVKVDAFCDADLRLDTQRIQSGSKILDFGTLQEMTILSRGALVADKMTSLAVGTVGIKIENITEIVKQIYDIATLLRQAVPGDLSIAYDSYQRLTEFKVGCFKRDPPYTVSDVTLSIMQSLGSFLPMETNALVSSDMLRRYDGFQGSYLSKLYPYKKSDHVTDVMLALLLAKSLQRHLEGSLPPSGSDEEEYMHAILRNLARLGRADVDDARMQRREYLGKISSGLISRKMIRDSPLEHVYLVKELDLLQ